MTALYEKFPKFKLIEAYFLFITVCEHVTLC